MKYYAILDRDSDDQLYEFVSVKKTTKEDKGSAQSETTEEKKQQAQLAAAVRMADPGKWSDDYCWKGLGEIPKSSTAVVEEILDDRGSVGLVVLGEGARHAIAMLAEIAKRNTDSISKGTYEPKITQVVFVAPQLDVDSFAATNHSLSADSLAVAACRRIVVLHGNGHLPNANGNSSFEGKLGHVGPSGAVRDNVLCLNIAHLLMCYLPGVSAAVSSLEVMGLVGRILSGTGDASLKEFVGKMYCCPPKPAA